ncbi:MAG: DNA mismatch repair protein MutS [Candidatus Omnitrophota bacterium]
METELTPMIRQYLDIKEKNTDSILFFRLGDFYEMFFDDAVEATRLLHITLTSRAGGKGNSKIPMCGVPYHAAENYIARLIKHGKKVAICEQTEEPQPGKKIVKREITRIITPGTFMADGLLDDAVNNYIMSLNIRSGICGLAYADISTGEFHVAELAKMEDLFSELYKISPSECLVPASLAKDETFKKIRDVNLGALTVNDDWMYDYELSFKTIKNHFRVESLEGFGCHNLPYAIGAAGALLKYLKDTQKTSLNNLDVITTYSVSRYMSLDRNSHRHLELIQNQEDLTAKWTLFDVLDQTMTPMGKRKLKREILNPLLDVKEIRARLDCVEYFVLDTGRRNKIRKLLENICDIERLSNKISLETANSRDILALASSIKNISQLKVGFSGEMPLMLKEVVSGMDELDDVVELVESCLMDSPPAGIKDGGIIRNGYSAEVDELRSLVSNGKDWVADLQEKEIKRTGINSLKVGYNKIFGYYIEVTKANLSEVPSDYVRKQTLVNAERFITEDLKEYESRIIGAEERIKLLEYEIFCDLRRTLSKQIDRLKRTSDQISSLDVLSNLGEVALKNRYVRPGVNDGRVLRIVEGRHPVLERILKDKEFVPNDLLMDDAGNRIFIITGSNMAGKSTYIRQIALITIMAQIGSFVPAKEAEIGVVDRIFTRVGASDRLYHGMSTFMVEMLETANILNNATNRSLIILDEIGRGTSTFDGVSIAWAVVEFIHHNLCGAKATFATHFHELTELTKLMKGIKNYHLAVQEWDDDIVFLYRVKEGSCDESFGIHVAKLAGMPEAVVKRAREILGNLQKDSFFGNIRSRFADNSKAKEKQFDLFEDRCVPHSVINEILDLDINKLTPLEALQKMAEFRKKAETKK